MTLTEALSDKHIDSLLDGTERSKLNLEKDFYSFKVTRNLKNGYWGIATDKSGNEFLLKVKYVAPKESITSWTKRK